MGKSALELGKKNTIMKFMGKQVQRRSWAGNVLKGAMFSRDNIWTNAAKMDQEEWYNMFFSIVRPFHRELACRHASSGAGYFASSCESNWSAHGLIHSEVRRLRSHCKFIPIERQWHRRLVTICSGHVVIICIKLSIEAVSVTM